MSPVGRGELSLTKFYRLRQLARELARTTPGMTEPEARSHFGSGHQELADDLLLYSNGRVVDDPLLHASRSGSRDTAILIWVALVMADHRIASIVETFLTDAHGKLVNQNFNTSRLEQTLTTVLPGRGGRKAATNILSYYRDSGLVRPRVRGSTIVGIGGSPSAAAAVPTVVNYVAFRLRHLGLGGSEPNDLELALRVEANRWINLTVDEFRTAYRAAAMARSVRQATQQARVSLPAGASAEEVSVEAQHAEHFAVSPQSAREATRREQALVGRYKAWMESKGSTILRLRYNVPGASSRLYCDIWDKTRNNLLEAKGSLMRPGIRMAIGQLIDYRRLSNPTPPCAVLLPEKPNEDLELMLRSVGIACVWQEGTMFQDNAGGQFS